MTNIRGKEIRLEGSRDQPSRNPQVMGGRFYILGSIVNGEFTLMHST